MPVERALRAAADHAVFWTSLSIGTEDISFLQEFDDLAGRRVDDADYQAVVDLEDLEDQELFDLLLAEYPEWLTAARQAGLLS